MIKKLLPLSLIVGSIALAGCSSNDVESPDLGKVLDIFDASLSSFSSTDSNFGDAATKANDAIMTEFGQYTELQLNNPPLTSQQYGLELQEDGSFQGYNDENRDYIRDSGEKTVFTVEIDTERSRLIATDESGSGTDTRFSATGFLAGMIIGNLLSRQKSSGVTSNKLGNRKTVSRSSYNSSRSAASSSARSKSFSGSHSSGK